MVVLWHTLFVCVNVLVVHTIYGCENNGLSTLRDKLTYSHLVLKGQATKQLNDTHYIFSVICIYKDNNQRVPNNVTVEAVTKDQEDGMCFYNEYQVGKQYIIFLRRLDSQLRSTYKEEEVDKEEQIVRECGIKVISSEPIGGKAVGCPKIVHRACPVSSTPSVHKRTKPPRRTKPRRTKPTRTTSTPIVTTTTPSIGKKSHRLSTPEDDPKPCETSCVVMAVVFSIAGGAGLSGLGFLYYRKYLYKVKPDDKLKIDKDLPDKSETTDNKKHSIINVAPGNIEVSKPPTYVKVK